MTKRWYQPVVVVLSVAALVGCASTSGDAELASMRTALDQATADAAEAKRMAAEAEREAAAAKLAAEQARTDAADANARSASTESKIDRMFKKAMYK